MRRDPPIYTFWAIIASSLAALVVTHVRQIPGEEAMPIFIGAMAMGVVIGEMIERWRHGSPAQ